MISLTDLIRAPHFGEGLSVVSGVVWASAVILFRVGGRTVGPLALNLFKNAVALAATVVLVVLLGRPLVPAVTPGEAGLLLFSGFLGIAVSDTFFLIALNLLGASLTAIVDCLYSPFVIVLSFAFIGERLSIPQLAGAGLIISAVLTAAGREGEGPASRRHLLLGIGAGVAAMFTVAAGIVMVKPILGRVTVVSATGLRLAGGLVPLTIAMALHPKRREWMAPLRQASTWKILVPGAFLGGFLSLLFWVGGMKYALASVAAALSQLNTIFIVILAIVFLRERLSWRKVAAVLLAFAGAFLASR